MRIASLSPAATEILFAMGKGGDIVCTDQFSNFPEETKAIPHLRDMVNVDSKSLREFQPEIVVLGTSIQKKLAEQLKSEGFAVLFDDPRTLQETYSWIRSLGAVFDCGKQAESVVLGMQQGFNDVKKKATLLPRKIRVYIEEWHEPPYASGNWVPELASIAGCVQYPVPTGELSPVVTLEQVAAFDPDMIVVSWCGAGLLADKKLLMERLKWSQLRAVQSGAVRVIDDSFLNRPGPRLVDGAQRLYGWAFEMLH